MELIEKTVSTSVAFSGRLMNVHVDEVMLPNGEIAVREWFCHRGAAVILAIDENGKVLMVRQYRHPLGRVTLELPAGKIDEGETPLECAARELSEETGCSARTLTEIARLAPAAAYTSEILYIFLAEGLVQSEAHPDEDEFLTLERWDIADALAAVDSGEIIDAKTQIGLLRYARIKEKG